MTPGLARMALARLTGRLDRPGHDARVPAGHAVYAVGDVHGRADLLDELLVGISADAAEHDADQRRWLIFLGDYVDRGMASRAVIERLLGAPPPGFTPIYLKGNHEQAMLDFIDGRSDGRPWLSYGGSETVLSYGVRMTGTSPATLRAALAEAVPPAHLQFMRGCALHHCLGDYVFVHAGIRPGVAFEQQEPRDLLWIRDEFLKAKQPLPGKVVVHGHSICRQPENRPHRINVDTGAFMSGRLSCVVLRGNTRRFFATGG